MCTYKARVTEINAAVTKMINEFIGEQDFDAKPKNEKDCQFMGYWLLPSTGACS